MTRLRRLAWRAGILKPLQLLSAPYRASPDETGREREFGFSPLAARWPAGQRAIDDLIGGEPAVAKFASHAAAD